jgi:hypothetical protein
MNNNTTANNLNDPGVIKKYPFKITSYTQKFITHVGGPDFEAGSNKNVNAFKKNISNATFSPAFLTERNFSDIDDNWKNGSPGIKFKSGYTNIPILMTFNNKKYLFKSGASVDLIKSPTGLYSDFNEDDEVAMPLEIKNTKRQTLRKSRYSVRVRSKSRKSKSVK